MISRLAYENLPTLLKEIPGAPSQIYIKGNLPNESAIKIAIVGTRKATPTGKDLARKIAKNLAKKEIVIVSGLAMGIDTQAHEGALEAQLLSGEYGKTIAVLANGLDSIYPTQNENLAKRIIENNGALISEYSPGTPSYPSQFLERNRIISGLCRAIIVIEAPERSGSLATAHFALEQGREIFVVPGPASHPNYQGSHKLIRDGARLITCVEDIFEDLDIEFPKNQIRQNKLPHPSFFIKDPIQLKIIASISDFKEPLTVDKISQLTKLDSQTINQHLGILIIQEIITEQNGKYFLKQ